MKNLIILAVLTISLILPSALDAQGFIVTDKPAVGLPNDRFIPRPPRPIDRFLPIQIQSTEVASKIEGQIATTTITQTLYNPCRRRVQGMFLFPVPSDSKIDSFSMEIDGELTEGELLDAKRARKIYEDIVRRTLDPALFEYSDQDLFKVRIFPFEPCKTKQIRLKYTQLLPKDGNLISYTLPLKAREHCLASGKKSASKFSLDVTVVASKGQKLRTVYSPSHDIDVDYVKKKSKASIELSDSKASPTSDFQLVFSSAPIDAKTGPVTTEFFTQYDSDKKGEGHFLLLVSPQVWADDKELPPLPKDVVFVLDSSASMRKGKLEKAKEGLEFCLGSLNPEDRFQIVRFSTDSETLFKTLVPASKENIEKAEGLVASIKAIGGTAVEEALSLAVETLEETPNKDKRPRQIVFITDGQPTLGETNEKRLVKGLQEQLAEAEQTAKVFSFGIGSRINTHLLDLLARETKAHAQFALPTEDIEHKISQFYTRFAEPVYSDLSIDIEGAEWIRSMTPKVLPDVFRGDQLVVLGRFKKDAKEGEITLKGNFRGEEKEYVFPISFAKGSSKNKFIPRLWAVRRVGWLLEQIRLNGESDELKDEVTSLAREYAIVTPYTSWLILEDEAVRNVPMSNRSFLDLERAPSRRGELKRKADAYSVEKTGVDALAAAASESDLKKARNTAAQTTAMTRANYSDGIAVVKNKDMPAAQIINGKCFYLNSGQWIDSESQSLAADVPVRKIQFGTDLYFTFLEENPAACQWFSAGDSLRLTLNDKEIIEITR